MSGNLPTFRSRVEKAPPCQTDSASADGTSHGTRILVMDCHNQECLYGRKEFPTSSAAVAATVQRKPDSPFRRPYSLSAHPPPRDLSTPLIETPESPSSVLGTRLIYPPASEKYVYFHHPGATRTYLRVDGEDSHRKGRIILRAKPADSAAAAARTQPPSPTAPPPSSAAPSPSPDTEQKAEPIKEASDSVVTFQENLHSPTTMHSPVRQFPRVKVLPASSGLRKIEPSAWGALQNQRKRDLKRRVHRAAVRMQWKRMRSDIGGSGLIPKASLRSPPITAVDSARVFKSAGRLRKPTHL